MAQETMGKWERVWGALTGEYMPDRVPVSPMVMSGAAAGLQGISQGKVYSDYSIALDALIKTYDQFGGWDQLMGWVFSEDMTYIGGVPYTWKLPGRDLPDDYTLQIHEEQTLSIDDIHFIIENGYATFVSQILRKRLYGWDEAMLKTAIDKYTKLITDTYNEFTVKRGVEAAYGSSTLHPFFGLSMGRTLIGFTEDLYYRGDLIEKAINRMTDDDIVRIIKECKASGKMVVGNIEERASAYNYPLHIFERFWLPYTARYLEALSAEGIITVFHMDQPWDKNIPLMKKYLPKRSFALQLDGTTNMIEAKKYMGDYCNFQGDVPASLMSIGTPEDVYDYCKRLIKEVGYDGMFILINGCECPIDVKPENLAAMLRAAKESFY